MKQEDTRLVNFLQTYKPLAPEPSEDCEVRLLGLISQTAQPSSKNPYLAKLWAVGLAIAGLVGVWLSPKLTPQVAEVLTEQERQEIVSQLVHDLSLLEMGDSSGLWLESNAELNAEL